MLSVSGLWHNGDLTDEANDGERYVMKTASRDNEDVTRRYGVKHLSRKYQTQTDRRKSHSQSGMLSNLATFGFSRL